MPPQTVEGVLGNVAKVSLQGLCDNDDVYNLELSWLAFNWRVLSMSTLTPTTQSRPTASGSSLTD